jgi:hypothetical protein
MTINSETRQAGPYIGTGIVSQFPFAFKVFTAADLLVVFADPDGVESVLIPAADYAVALNGDQDSNPGGVVTLLAGPLSTGARITLTSKVAAIQPIAPPSTGDLDPAVITTALDRLTIIAQQTLGGVARSIKGPISDSPGATFTLPSAANRASQVLGFDARGSVALYGAGSSVTTAENVTYLPGGVGAVARTVRDKLREVVSVGDFGAVGDGVTDDTAAFQAALDAAIEVQVPTGSYKITASLILRAGHRIAGNGLLVNGATGPLEFFKATGTVAGGSSLTDPPILTRMANIGITGLQFDSTGRSESFAIVASGVQDLVVTGVRAKECRLLSVQLPNLPNQGPALYVVPVTDVTGVFAVGDTVKPRGSGSAATVHGFGAGLLCVTFPVSEIDLPATWLAGATIEGQDGATATAITTDTLSCDPVRGAGVTSESQLNNSVQVSRCSVSFAGYDASGIFMSYIVNFVVSDCIFKRTNIVFWGGDANFGRGGDIRNPRRCSNGVISGNVVTGGNGSIWGANGQNITVTANHVQDDADVGIDFEGCFDCVASANTCINSANANLSVFFAAKNVIFTGNTVVGTTPGRNCLFYNKNSSQSENEIIITITGNIFEWRGEGLGIIHNEPGARAFIFSNNTLTNTKVDLNRINAGDLTIANNALFYLSAQAEPFVAIQAGSNHGRRAAITNNKISSPAQPSGSIGIAVEQADFNSSVTTKISNNDIGGFPVSIQTQRQSSNPGITCYYLLSDNNISGTIENTATERSYQIWSNNRNLYGQPTPGDIPASGLHYVGSTLQYATISAGGYLGAVCVVSGMSVSGGWAASTAYAVGARVSNDTNVYEVTAAGTSASSGGPTGTGGAISDGTVTWQYLSPLAVWRSHSAIASAS